MKEEFYKIHRTQRNTIDTIFKDTRTQAEIEDDTTLNFNFHVDNIAEFLDSIYDSFEKLNDIYNPYFESHIMNKEKKHETS